MAQRSAPPRGSAQVDTAGTVAFVTLLRAWVVAKSDKPALKYYKDFSDYYQAWCHLFAHSYEAYSNKMQHVLVGQHFGVDINRLAVPIEAEHVDEVLMLMQADVIHAFNTKYEYPVTLYNHCKGSDWPKTLGVTFFILYSRAGRYSVFEERCAVEREARITILQRMMPRLQDPRVRIPIRKAFDYLCINDKITVLG